MIYAMGRWVIGVGVLGFGAAVASGVQAFVLVRMGQRLGRRLRVMCFESVLRQNIGVYACIYVCMYVCMCMCFFVFA